MSEKENTQSVKPVSGAEEIVRTMGLVFNNTYLYGAKHSVTIKAVEDSFAFLTKALESSSEITFNVSEEGVFVNGQLIELKNPLMQKFAEQMTDHEVNSLTIEKGMSAEKYLNLIEILNAKPDELKKLGGFVTALSTFGVDNVKSKRVIFQQVTEDDEIVSREGLEKVISKDKIDQVVAGGKKAEPKTLEEMDEDTKKVHVDNILAFIKGDVPADSPEALASISKAASSADQLGEIIMKSAEVRQETAELDGGESFGNLVVGCLRRTYDGLSKNPAVKTQKGKKELSKTLMLLEKDVLDKMRDMAGEVSKEDEAHVSEAIEEMVDELKMDALASDYMKKRTAIDSNEKKLLRYIKSKGLENIEAAELKDKLMESGLTPEGWRELLVKSGAAGGAGGGEGSGSVQPSGGAMAAVGQLAMLLTRMEDSVKKEESKEKVAQDVTETLTKVDEEAKALASKTERKIDKLVKDVKQNEEIVDAAEKEAVKKAKKPIMTRKKMLEILAEIGQELCQPLAVINCSVDMIRGKSLGEISEQQDGMLKLAAESSERLKVLIDRFVEIAGMPESRSPDEEMISSFYDK